MRHGSGNRGGSRGNSGDGGSSGEDRWRSGRDVQDGSDVGGMIGRVYPAGWAAKTKAQNHRYKQRRRK